MKPFMCSVSDEVRHSAFGCNDGFGEGRRGNQSTQVPPQIPPPSFFPLGGKRRRPKRKGRRGRSQENRHGRIEEASAVDGGPEVAACPGDACVGCEAGGGSIRPSRERPAAVRALSINYCRTSGGRSSITHCRIRRSGTVNWPGGWWMRAFARCRHRASTAS